MLLQDTVCGQAERNPEAVAVVFKEQSVTYRELEEQSNQLARLLRMAGCEKGDRVGLLLPKSIAAIVGMLGVLKAGCVYVPMDKASPAARLAKIVDACEPRCILAVDATAKLLNASLSDYRMRNRVRVGWVEPGKFAEAPVAFSWEDLSSVSPLPVGCDTRPEDAAHLLFTSGSTGTPKGVVITHSNVMHFLTWATQYFQTAPSDRISCHPPLHFDLSTFDIWGTFLAGAQLHLVPYEISLLPNKVADFIRGSELTQWFSVPSALRYMAQFDVVRFNDFPSLRRLLWCGEALPTPTLIYWMKRLPDVTFTNLYGPTETTIASSYYTVPSCPENEKSAIPIGRACDGEELLVLDEALRPVAVGAIGDLYIGGVGLSPGYWKDPEKTKSVFLDDPHRGRIYKTGDLARIGDDGLIYLLGRADSQVKSRGYRIELGEIETALHALGLLRECVVVAVQTDGFEGMAICCAYVPTPGMNVSPSDLRQRLTQVVPSYMLPSQWMPFTALPLNANGKVDRPRLREHFSTQLYSENKQRFPASCSSGISRTGACLFRSDAVAAEDCT
jgi:amino acid adenylation domain-containing protein